MKKQLSNRIFKFLLEFIYLKPIIDCPSFLSLEVKQFSTCISRSGTVEIQISLKSTSPSVNSLLGIESLRTNGGSDELNIKEQEMLIKSTLARTL